LIEHIEKYGLAEQKLAKEYKQAQSAQDYFRILEEVGPLHHAAKNLHATLQAAREAIPDDRDIIDMRDWAYDLARTLELLQADTQNALNFHSVQVANRLNVLAAIFFPVTAIASIFGMNLASGLEGSSVMIFWSVLLVGIALGFATSWWALRMRA
jgi:Mg2+ and Co2+ transporter CorA